MGFDGMDVVDWINPLNYFTPSGWKKMYTFGERSAAKNAANETYAPPSFVGGTFSRGGDQLASISKDGNNVSVNYNESPEQKAQRMWRQSSIYDTEKTVGQPYPEQMKRWADIANYRKQRALDAYDEDSTPSWQKFITNSYDKFGGLQNTQSVLGFNEIDKARNKYKQQLASDYDYNIESLGQQEDSRLMNLANFLMSGQNYDDNIMNNYLSQAFNASQLGNTQALNAAGLQNQMAQLNLYQDQLGQQNSNANLSGLLNAAALAAMFIPGGQAASTGLSTLDGLSNISSVTPTSSFNMPLWQNSFKKLTSY